MTENPLHFTRTIAEPSDREPGLVSGSEQFTVRPRLDVKRLSIFCAKGMPHLCSGFCWDGQICEGKHGKETL